MAKKVAAPQKQTGTAAPTVRSGGAVSDLTSGKRPGSKALNAFVSTAVIAVALFATFLAVEIFHQRVDWPLDYGTWEIAEMIIIVALMLAFGIFAVGRWRELVRETAERQRAEETLREREETLKKTFASLDEAAFVVDSNTRIIIACNPAAERIFGYSEREMMGRKTEFLHVDRAMYENFGRKLMPALDADGVFHTEYKMRRKDGSVFFSEHTVTEIVDGSGQRTGVVSVGRDITERKRTEEALRESEEKYRDLVEKLNVAIFEVDATGRITYVSPVVEEISEYSPSEIIGRSFRDFVHPDDLPANIARFQKGISGNPEPGDYRVMSKSGEVRWLHSLSRPVMREGNVAGLRGVLTDITERKQAEEALSESEERFRSAFEHAAIGMVLVSPDSRLLKANGSFCQMVGYSQKELESMTWQDISHPDDLDTGIEQMRRMLTGEIDSCQFEKRYLHKRGHVVWVLLSFSLVRDAVDRPLHFISQIQDISERKRMEEALQAAREELEAKVERQMLRRNPYGLTFRELTVLHLVAAGESDKQIGLTLGISPLTAQKHISNILAKMEAPSRTEAAVRALREGLLD